MKEEPRRRKTTFACRRKKIVNTIITQAEESTKTEKNMNTVSAMDSREVPVSPARNKEEYKEQDQEPDEEELALTRSESKN